MKLDASVLRHIAGMAPLADQVQFALVSKRVYTATLKARPPIVQGHHVDDPQGLFRILWRLIMDYKSGSGKAILHSHHCIKAFAAAHRALFVECDPGSTMLYWACSQSYPALVQALIEAGADATAIGGPQHLSLAQHAYAHGDTITATLIVESIGDAAQLRSCLDNQSNTQRTLLFSAIEKGI